MANEQDQKDLLKRMEWAFQNRDAITSILTIHQDAFLRIIKGFVKGYDLHIHNYDQVLTLFDTIAIPSVERILSGAIYNAGWKNIDGVPSVFPAKLHTDSEPAISEESKNLLIRFQWAIAHRNLIKNARHDNEMYFRHAVNAYENGLIDIHVRQLDSLTELLDNLGIPSVDEINSGFDKNNMQVRGQAFANAVDQLKASVECTSLVEDKIQDILSNQGSL